MKEMYAGHFERLMVIKITETTVRCVSDPMFQLQRPDDEPRTGSIIQTGTGRLLYSVGLRTHSEA